MTAGNMTTVNAVGYNSPMPDSRDKANRWINLALALAFMLAPAAWYVAVINGKPIRTDRGVDHLEPQLMDAVKTYGEGISTLVADFTFTDAPYCDACQQFGHDGSIKCLLIWRGTK